MNTRVLSSRLRDFADETHAGITIWALFNFMIILIFAGLALDVNNAVRSRTQLQGAADAAGHAALISQLKNKDVTVAAQDGIDVAEANMPTSLFGNVLATADIEFGDWERKTRSFVPGAGTTAVRVSTRRLDSRGNSVSTFLMNLLGITTLELNTTSVWDYEDGICVTNDADGVPGEGFFAIGPVDMQTGNTFGKGFCIHSEDHVKLSSNNTFLEDVFISMPNLADLQMPTAGWTNNVGINDALHQGGYPMLKAFFAKPGGEFYKMVAAYDDAHLGTKFEVVELSLSGGETLTKDMVDTAAKTVTNGKTPLIRAKCSGQTLTIGNDENLSGTDLVTDCKIKFNQGSSIENMTLVTTNTDKMSITGPNGTRWGNPSYCGNKAVGGVTVMTLGGISMAADFEGHGLEIISADTVKMAAKADGFTSINVVSAGAIDITANSNFGFCSGDAPNSFKIPAFRMVM